MRTLGIKVFNGVKILLLYISAQISYPPSIHKFLYKIRQNRATYQTHSPNTYLNAPTASTTTSSSLSVSRVIRAPTTFFPCNNLRVDGSFWIRLDTATQAHLRSAPSALSNYGFTCIQRLEPTKNPSKEVTNLLDNRQDLV